MKAPLDSFCSTSDCVMRLPSIKKPSAIRNAALITAVIRAASAGTASRIGAAVFGVVIEISDKTILRVQRKPQVHYAATLECGGLAPLCYRSRVIKVKAAPGRRTPKWRQTQ